MPEEKLIAGNITLLKTKYVGSTRDGLLPPMIERVKKMTGKQITYFADGQGCEYNLVNNKGQNQFIGQNTVIEISEPHLDSVIWLQHEMGFEDSEHLLIKHLIAFDMMNQAIGRTCGYRYSDAVDLRKQKEKESGKKSVTINEDGEISGESSGRLPPPKVDDETVTVVLCAPKLFKSLISESRYYLTRADDLDKGDGVYWKLGEDDEKSLVKTISWLIQNYVRYATRGLKSDRPAHEWLSDIRLCLETSNQVKKDQRKKRLLDAMMGMEKRAVTPNQKSLLKTCINQVSSF